MKKYVSFAGSQEGESFSFVFVDENGDKFFLNELKQPVEGMSPFVYDQIANLKNVMVETKDIQGFHYVTRIYLSKKDFR